MLIKLTGVSHPDQPGETPIYIDAARVICITRSVVSYNKKGAEEAYRQALESLWDEVIRVGDEVNNMQKRVAPENEEEARATELWLKRKGVADELGNAYKLVSYYAKTPLRHPEVRCTQVDLACGTALEQGVMLTHVWVTESPDEVARLITGFAQ